MTKRKAAPTVLDAPIQPAVAPRPIINRPPRTIVTIADPECILPLAASFGFSLIKNGPTLVIRGERQYGAVYDSSATKWEPRPKNDADLFNGADLVICLPRGDDPNWIIDLANKIGYPLLVPDRGRWARYPLRLAAGENEVEFYWRIACGQIGIPEPIGE